MATDDKTTVDTGMLEMFKDYDKNGDGYVSKEEMLLVMKSFGVEMSDEEMAAIVKDADKNGDGRIDYQEFTKMMGPQPMPEK